jgi:sugar phosphate isomerase/epimerase
MRPICIDWLTAPELDAPGLVSAAASNGVGRVSLIVHHMNPFPDFDLIGDTPARRETRLRCKALDVKVDCMEVLRLHPDTDPKSFRAAFESGAYLDARTAVVLAFDPDEERLADTLSRTCEIAADYGILVVTELNRRFTLKSLADARRVFGKMKRSDIMVQIDSLHFYRYGSELPEILEHRALIGRAQLCDGPLQPPSPEEQMAEGRANRLLPGEGELPLVPWLQALPKDIVVALESPLLKLDVYERLRRGVQRTKELVEIADGEPS